MRHIVSIAALALFCAGSAGSQWVFQPMGAPGEAWHWVVHPVDDQVVWVAKDHAYARTTDGGVTWQQGPIAPAPAEWWVGDIHGLDAMTAWVALYDALGQSSGGVYWTADGGATWSRQESLFKEAGGFVNAVHFFDADNGMCAGDARINDNFEIYTTRDGGEKWTRVPVANLPPLADPSLGEYFLVGREAHYGDCVWFATDQNRILRTTDRGHTWSAFPTGHSGGWGGMAFVDEINGILTQSEGPTLRTTDGGVTWSVLPLPGWLMDPPQNLSHHMPASVPGHPNTLVMSTEGYCGAERRFLAAISTDGGDTWGRMSMLFGNLPAFAASGVGYMSGNRGMYKWPAYTGRHICLCAPAIRYAGAEVGTTGEDEIVTIGNYGTEPLIVTSLAFAGLNFTLLNPPVTPLVLDPWEFINVAIGQSPTVRGSVVDSLVVVSDAVNAPALATTLTGKGLGFHDVLVGDDTLFAIGEALYRLDIATGEASPRGALDLGQIHGVAVCPMSMCLYGVSAGADGSTLYRIDPLGVGGVELATVPVGDLWAIAFSPSGTLFAGTRTGTLLRINPATGDTAVMGSAAGLSYASLAFSPEGELFASVRPALFNKDAIYRIDTTNGRASMVGKTGDNAITPAIAFDASGQLYGLKWTAAGGSKLIRIDPATGAGTEIGETGIQGLQGLAAVSLLATSVTQPGSEAVPGTFALAQNYPNPFNPTTTIEYALPHAGYATLKLYNVLGEEVATLVEGQQSAGTFKAKWDASDVPSGVYFYRLTAGQHVQTRKMLLMR